MERKLTTRERLLNSTLEVIADVGIENASTALIARTTGCSEAMIYRFFTSKYEMIQHLFREIEKEIFEIVPKALEESGDRDAVLKIVWTHVWNYLLENPVKTLFLIRYRSSALYSAEEKGSEAEKAMSFLTEKTEAAYPEGFVSGCFLDILLVFAERVVRGMIERTDELENKVWQIVETDCRILTA